eukprot:Pgem_evm1s11129
MLIPLFSFNSFYCYIIPENTGKEISIKSINALVSLYKELVNRISSINSFNML